MLVFYFLLEGDSLDRLFIIVLSTICGLVVLGTVSNNVAKEHRKDNFFLYLSSFCIRENMSELMTYDSKQSLTFSTLKLGPLAIIACGHAFTALNTFFTVDSFTLENSAHSKSAYLVRGWQMYMPLVFMSSGYLLSMPWIKRLMDGGKLSAREDILQPLMRRLARFIPSMAFVVLFHATLFYNLYSDPQWLEVVANDRVNCKENGWINLLFLSNIVNSREAVSRLLSMPLAKLALRSLK